MNQLQFLDLVEEAINDDKFNLNIGDMKQALQHLDDIRSQLSSYYKNYFIKELSNESCQHYEAAGYEDWYSYFEDTDGIKEGLWMREVITEEECDTIWEETHK